ncbi:hypothetical protein PHMEG_0007299 [Phytophthora megakarya]|uniref:Uncharacterized protein n=1 Tax=Phytophthora megakarya TaxID=4795 RepID=A0A225WM90_9STRA|nr:hypothetical protein PHMEG_0007299 [Phytophthora megakarya]
MQDLPFSLRHDRHRDQERAVEVGISVADDVLNSCDEEGYRVKYEDALDVGDTSEISTGEDEGAPSEEEDATDLTVGTRFDQMTH